MSGSTVRRWTTARVWSTPSCRVRATSSRAWASEIRCSASRRRPVTNPATRPARPSRTTLDITLTESPRLHGWGLTISPTPWATPIVTPATSPPCQRKAMPAVITTAIGHAEARFWGWSMPL